MSNLTNPPKGPTRPLPGAGAAATTAIRGDADASDSGRLGRTAPAGSAPPTKKIRVHIRGEVVSPGVYSVDDGACVNDLVVEAGGLNDRASLSDTINLAEKVRDGQVVTITSTRSASSQSESTPLVMTQRAVTNIPEPPNTEAMRRLLQPTDPRIAEEKEREAMATAEANAKTASKRWWWRTLIASGILTAFALFGVAIIAWIASNGAWTAPIAFGLAVAISAGVVLLVVLIRARRNRHG